MYKILIIGHGKFPEGAHDASNLIVGVHDYVSHMSIDNEKGHDYLKEEIGKFLDENEHVILFADFSGGAPHKIGARAIIASGKKTQFIVSGAPISFLIQVIATLPNKDSNPKDVKANLKELLDQSFKTARVMGV